MNKRILEYLPAEKPDLNREISHPVEICCLILKVFNSLLIAQSGRSSGAKKTCIKTNEKYTSHKDKKFIDLFEKDPQLTEICACFLSVQ